jgi:hypothetical protein
MLLAVIELLPLTLVCLYFVPFMVAAARDHDSYIAVLVVNALVGWTGIGWLACMIWASFTPTRALSVTPATFRRVP